MQIVNDPRETLMFVKDPQRVFCLQCPVKADLAEINGVVSQAKEKWWNLLEKKKEQEEKEKQDKESCEKCEESKEVPVETK